jgi:hypothetical protein
MSRTKTSKVPFPIQFELRPHCRVHGPQGHSSYAAYKPWLRDEFQFRCVYCLTRELWSPAGQRTFTIDHVKPKSRHASLVCVYDNLVYACAWCNTLKSTTLGLPDPCRTALGKHLKLERTGKFVGRTPQGKRLVEYLRLNAQERIIDRTRALFMFERQRRFANNTLRLWFGYPADLPDLVKLKPPKGNTRPAGIQKYHLARQRRGELPPYY